MVKRLKLIASLFVTLMLSACGGGGGGGGSFQPPATTVSVSVGQAQTTPRSLVDVLVTARTSNGAPLPNGTQITLQVSPPAVGEVSFISDGGAGGGSSGPIVIGDRVNATVVGGSANFRFHSRSLGTAVLTASLNDPNAPARVITGTANINVAPGPASDPRLQIAATTTTLPANIFDVPPFLGSPYLSEVTVTWRRLNGELVTTFPQGRENSVSVNVNPILNTGGFCTLDDPETTDINEFQLRLGQAPVDTIAGKATLFLRSLDLATTTVMTVTALDPDTDETLEAQLTFNIVNGSPRLPASLALTRSGRPIYIDGSGGNTSDQIEAAIRDGSGTFVPDPVSGSSAYNNIRAEIVGGLQGGDRLRTVNAQGATVQGAVVNARSFNGLASFNYEAGTQARVVQIRVTSDRADNNVDNGISDPVSATMNVTVSDGILFDLDITGPSVSAIIVNPVSDQADADGFPLDPDGSYSLTISAIATDRQGNPVVPGTEIRFGSIDEPLQNNAFVIADDDGDPQEGSTGFTDADGAFTSLGGGAGPGDTLLVFGEEITGNRDLESARTVQTVNGPSNITVNRRFNFNDDTGVSVNNGAVLPYVIGRAVDGNIHPVAYTDANGVARTQLNYPVSKLGKLAGIYAQGNGDIVSGTPELVTDAEFIRFPGVGPGQLVANPSAIPGNRTVAVEVCYYDALNSPISGSFINFTFQNLNGGTGRVDGVTTAGVSTSPTGPDGCVDVSVQTLGMVPSGAGGSMPQVIFSVGAAEAPVDIITGSVILSASPTAHAGDGGRLIQLTLTAADGTPIQGAVITGTCTVNGAGTLSITNPPQGTNAQGQTTTVVTANGFSLLGAAAGPTGTCTFSTVGGAATATVTWTSQNLCELFSPLPPAGCPSSTINLAITGVGSSVSSPSGLTCQGPTLGVCTAVFSPNTPVTITLNAPPISWGAECAGFGNAQVVLIVTGPDGAMTNCTVNF